MVGGGRSLLRLCIFGLYGAIQMLLLLLLLREHLAEIDQPLQKRRFPIYIRS